MNKSIAIGAALIVSGGAGLAGVAVSHGHSGPGSASAFTEVRGLPTSKPVVSEASSGEKAASPSIPAPSVSRVLRTPLSTPSMAPEVIVQPGPTVTDVIPGPTARVTVTATASPAPTVTKTTFVTVTPTPSPSATKTPTPNATKTTTLPAPVAGS